VFGIPMLLVYNDEGLISCEEYEFALNDPLIQKNVYFVAYKKNVQEE
jgi:hypothetical protein